MNNRPTALETRRQWLLGSASAAVGGTLLQGSAQAQTAPALPTTSTSAAIPLVLPRTEFVYEAVAELSPSMALGTGPLGERRMVPITGGTFEGPGLRG